MTDLRDPADPVIVAAMSLPCELCKAAPTVGCRNTINPDVPLPGGRCVHYARIEQWDVP